MIQKQIIEFLTVATEFCAYLEETEQKSKQDFFETTPKLLSLLYLKASMITVFEESDGFCEQFVSEADYMFIKNSISAKIGEADSFITIIDPSSYENSETFELSISECFADIYQDVREFIARYKQDNDELRQNALEECIMQFKIYWGPRVLSLLLDLHNKLYSNNSFLFDED